MQPIIEHASVIYQAYGIPPFAIGGLFAFSIMLFLFRRIGVAAYTFPALILMVIFGLIFLPQELFEAVTTGPGSDEARQRIAELEALAPARYIAAPVLGLTTIIFLRGHYIVPVVLITAGLVYLIEAELNPTSLASYGLPTFKVSDVDAFNLRNLQLGGGASGVSDSVSGLAGSIPLGK